MVQPMNGSTYLGQVGVRGQTSDCTAFLFCELEVYVWYYSFGISTGLEGENENEESGGGEVVRV